jgi:hypothetical protein
VKIPGHQAAAAVRVATAVHPEAMRDWVLGRMPLAKRLEWRALG